MSSEKETQGLQWSAGAIGTAVWTGVKLRDVLRYAGLLEIQKGEKVETNVRHVQVGLRGVRVRCVADVLGR
jgi:sulfite oxidase